MPGGFVRVTGWGADGLAYHPAVGLDGYYAISHIRSGMTVYPNAVRPEGRARAMLAAALDSGIDWTASGATLRQLPKKRRDAMRAAVEAACDREVA
jgi:hypothetical protein